MRRRLVLVVTGLLCWGSAAANKPVKRPKIYGIASVKILSSDVPAAHQFYLKLAAVNGDCEWCKHTSRESVRLPGAGLISIAEMPAPRPASYLASIRFSVESEKQMERYLTANGVKFTLDKGAERNGPPPSLSLPIQKDMRSSSRNESYLHKCSKERHGLFMRGLW